MDAVFAMLLIFCIVLQIVNIGLVAYFHYGSFEKRARDRNEAEVEEAMEREAREAQKIDEGFQNIMRFEVNGKTGFEGDF